jgi:hypothetical protein
MDDVPDISWTRSVDAVSDGDERDASSSSDDDRPRASAVTGLGGLMSLMASSAGGEERQLGGTASASGAEARIDRGSQKRKRNADERPSGGPAPERKRGVARDAKGPGAGSGAAAERAPRAAPNGICPTAIYVSGLPWSFSETDMAALVAAHGRVVESHVARDAKGNSRGFGFVRLAEADMVSRVLAAAAAVPIVAEGRTLTLGPCRSDIVSSYAKNPTPVPEHLPAAVFVKQLPFRICTSEDLMSVFSPFGTVVEARVACDAQGRGRGFGYAIFEDAAAAARARATVVVADDRVVTVEECLATIIEKFRAPPASAIAPAHAHEQVPQTLAAPQPPARIFGSTSSMKPRSVRR